MNAASAIANLSRSEFAIPRVGGNFVSASGLLGGREISKVSALSTNLDHCHPLIPCWIPVDTSVFRGSVSMRSGVVRVFYVRSEAQIAPSVVERVAIDVIDQEGFGGVDYYSMHKDVVRSRRIVLAPPASGVSTVEMPAKWSNTLGVGGVNSCKLTSGQRNEKCVIRASQNVALRASALGGTVFRWLAWLASELLTATYAGTINRHGDLQSLCRTPGPNQSGAGASLTILPDFMPKMGGSDACAV